MGKNLITPLLGVGLALLLSSAVILLAGNNPWQVGRLLLSGSLGSWTTFSRVLSVWAPLTLCSCGLLYTFRMGLWNIGIEGQMIIGAVTATAVLRLHESGDPGLFFLAPALLAAMAGGAAWGMLAGALKGWGRVHEIFSGLGLNFVAQALVLWLVFGAWKRPGIASMSGTEIMGRTLWLFMPQGWRVSPLAVLLCTLCLIISALFLHRYRLGLQLKAVGCNPRASRLFGLSVRRASLLAMALAGLCAGMAGFLQLTGVYHRLIPAISSNYGYLALLVVLLANRRLLLVPFIALFFSCLNVAAIQLPMVLNTDSSLVGVIQGASVLSALLVQAHHGRAGEGDYV